MIETRKICYCDILSQHNGQRVDGARTYKDIIVMKQDDNGAYVYPTKTTVDMCPTCYAKYKSNLNMSFDTQGKTVFAFGT